MSQRLKTLIFRHVCPEKANRSGIISIQVIDKSGGSYRVVKTIGSSQDSIEVEKFVLEAKRFIQSYNGAQELDFTDYRKTYSEVLSAISSHKLLGIEYVLGRIFDTIGFSAIKDSLHQIMRQSREY